MCVDVRDLEGSLIAPGRLQAGRRDRHRYLLVELTDTDRRGAFDRFVGQYV